MTEYIGILSRDIETIKNHGGKNSRDEKYEI